MSDKQKCAVSLDSLSEPMRKAAESKDTHVPSLIKGHEIGYRRALEHDVELLATELAELAVTEGQHGRDSS